MQSNKTMLRKVYDENKQMFHLKFGKNCELHHIWGRVGIFLACPHFFSPEKRNHQLNWLRVKELKERTLEDKICAEGNFRKWTGCFRKDLFLECSWCAMPFVKLWRYKNDKFIS